MWISGNWNILGFHLGSPGGIPWAGSPFLGLNAGNFGGFTLARGLGLAPPGVFKRPLKNCGLCCLPGDSLFLALLGLCGPPKILGGPRREALPSDIFFPGRVLKGGGIPGGQKFFSASSPRRSGVLGGSLHPGVVYPHIFFLWGVCFPPPGCCIVGRE